MQESTSNDTNSATNNINCNVIPVFPSLILSFEVPEYKELLPKVEKLRRQDPKGKEASNMGGWHSQWMDIPPQVRKYIPFPAFHGISWYMVNVNLQGNCNHHHPQNDWAGVLWLKTPPNAAKLEFEHPDVFAQYDAISSIEKYHPEMHKGTMYYKAYSFTPREGQMLLFPASLRHHVYFSTTDEERIALSFNVSIDDQQTTQFGQL